MKKLLLNIVILIACFLTSCTRFIGPPLAGPNNIGYLPRPLVMDSSQSKTYLSGELSLGASFDGHTTINSGILSLSRGYTNSSKNWNASVGLIGFLGSAKYEDSYDNGTISRVDLGEDKFHKSFGGWGLRTTIGIQKVSINKRSIFRIINWENAYSQESGEYPKFRNSLTAKEDVSNNNEAYVNVSSITKVFTTGLSSELIFSDVFKNKKSNLGIRIFAGFSPRVGNSFYRLPNSNNEKSESRPLLVSTNFYLSYAKIFGIAQAGTGDRQSVAKIGIGYTL